jgi:hypothetical protein
MAGFWLGVLTLAFVEFVVLLLLLALAVDRDGSEET